MCIFAPFEINLFSSQATLTAFNQTLLMYFIRLVTNGSPIMLWNTGEEKGNCSRTFIVHFVLQNVHVACWQEAIKINLESCFGQYSCMSIIKINLRGSIKSIYINSWKVSGQLKEIFQWMMLMCFILWRAFPGCRWELVLGTSR